VTHSAAVCSAFEMVLPNPAVGGEWSKARWSSADAAEGDLLPSAGLSSEGSSTNSTPAHRIAESEA